MAKSHGLLVIIIRTSILFFVSMAVSFLFYFLYAMRIAITSPHYKFFTNLLFVVDIWTNFICIYLTHKNYHKYYKILCGGCDKKCHQLLTKNNPRKDVSNLEAAVASI